MEALTPFRQLISVASAPVYANTRGVPLEQLGGQYTLPRSGWPLQDWPFGEGLARSWHGQLSPGPGAQGPVAPVGVMPAPEHMPNTGYEYPLPERLTGRVVLARG